MLGHRPLTWPWSTGRRRINPARSNGHTYAGLRAAQSLATEAKALLAALELMWARGERELHVPTLTQALQALDGERRASRVTIPS